MIAPYLKKNAAYEEVFSQMGGIDNVYAHKDRLHAFRWYFVMRQHFTVENYKSNLSKLEGKLFSEIIKNPTPFLSFSAKKFVYMISFPDFMPWNINQPPKKSSRISRCAFWKLWTLRPAP